MTTLQRIVLRGVLTIAFVGALLVRPASGQTIAGGGDTLQAVLDRIHEHAANEAWRQADWKDDQIERWLEKLAGTVAKAADYPRLKLPVRFGDVKPADAAGARTFDKALLIGKNINLRSAQLRHSIVLADGNVEVDNLEGCVVVARGAVCTARSNRSIVVAGAYARIGSDGQPSKTDQGSLIVTRGWANIQSIHGSVIAAAEGIAVDGIPDGGIFINATLVMGSSIAAVSATRPRSVKIRDLPLDDLSVHPLAGRLAVAGVVYPEAVEPPRRGLALIGRNSQRPLPTGIVFRLDGRRYLADVGQAIVDQADRPVAELAGWQLSFLDDNIAIFSSDDADAVVRVSER